MLIPGIGTHSNNLAVDLSPHIVALYQLPSEI